MKKILCIFLALVLLLICGCSSDSDKVQPTVALLDEYLENVDSFEGRVREFGVAASYIDAFEDLVISVIYPETQIETLDNAINQWVDETLEKYKAEASKTKGTEIAELSVTYDSYSVNETTLAIKLSGTFFSPSMAHPIDLLKTFNFDITNQKILTLNDILTEDGINALKKLVSTKAEINTEEVDDGILNYFLVTNETLEIILNRGDYLPMSEGSKTISVPFEELGDVFCEAFFYKPPKPEPPPPPAVPQPVAPMPPVNTGGGMIALTFDDGPSAHTERLLNIFATYGGKGTFFVMGSFINGREETLKRIVNEGHQIGNHSWSHRLFTSITDPELTDQIMMTRAKIMEVTGVDCTLVRPPYGGYNDTVRLKGEQLGVTFVNWDIDTLDWKYKNASKIHNHIMKYANNGAIILCHDLHKTTVDAMETAIPKLIESGYQLVTVSELLTSGGQAMVPGMLYYRR